MSAYDAARWSDFALAQLGASAALLGLVFVGLSINLKDVIGSRQLVNRALEAVVALGSVLVASTAVVFRLQIGAAGQVAQPGREGPPPISIAVRRVLGLGAALLLAVAGITLAASAGGGLYWWPAAIVVAYLGALTNAWVLIRDSWS